MRPFLEVMISSVFLLGLVSGAKGQSFTYCASVDSRGGVGNCEGQGRNPGQGTDSRGTGNPGDDYGRDREREKERLDREREERQQKADEESRKGERARLDQAERLRRNLSYSGERLPENGFSNPLLKSEPDVQVGYPVGPLVKLPLSPKESNYRPPVPVLPGSLPPGISSSPVEHPEIQCGSVIQVDNLSLGEVIPIIGLPFDLVYFSDRVPGRLGDYQLHVPLRDLAPPSSNATLNMSLAGRTSSVQIDTTKSDRFDFLWEGLDSQGTFPIGKVLAKVTIDGQKSDGWVKFVGNFKPNYLGLGGWGLSNLHYFSKDENLIYLGNGKVQKVDGTKKISFPSDNGSEIYVFNSNGTHSTTKNSRTGAILFFFSYDEQGRISKITDSYENKIEFIRDGRKVEIVGPSHRRTSLVVGDRGYLASVSNEAQETYQMKYFNGGLLAEFQKPQGQLSQFTYNNLGYLERDLGAGGNSLLFSGQIDGTEEKKIDLKWKRHLVAPPIMSYPS
ncbi:MAG: hypothetical protein IPL83_07495 [Bdellovibrionales bacterium]|nr:hypothetical protein [Bdellovibrionales bacterium]